MSLKYFAAGLLALSLAACGNNEVANTASNTVKSAADTVASSGRDQIKIVGSSTVYPFATTVAENFGRTTSFKTPIVESTGSGRGIEAFLLRSW